MRQRAFLLFLTCLVFTSLAVLLLPSRRGASFNKIVKETQEKISHLSDNLISDQSSPDLLAPSPVYLTTLGLSGPGWPQLYPLGSWLVAERASQPSLVSAVEPGQAELGLGFIRSATHFLPDTSLLLYDLGVSRSARLSPVVIITLPNCTLGMRRSCFSATVTPPCVAYYSLTTRSGQGM